MDRNNTDSKMACTRRSVSLMLIGVVVMISGYILMAGGGVKDPEVFNYAMFDFRRLVAAPLVILAGIVVEVLAIMGVVKEKNK